MKRIIVIAVFITVVMFSFYCIYSSFIADAYPMTEEQYAREAQNIVNYSPRPCQLPLDAAEVTIKASWQVKPQCSKSKM